ncbi:MAG: acyl carrier protein [Myxococcota bacterium]|nr:acyl carrier protein [Myxococcota bacterium]
MEQQEIEEAVRRLVAEGLELAIDEVDLDASVEEVANSLELSTIFYEVEKHFEVVFADSDIGRLRILRDIATVVREASS